MKLVEDARNIHKTYSFWGMVAGGLILLQDLLPFWEGIVPDKTFSILGAVALSAGLVGRYIKQNLKGG